MFIVNAKAKDDSIFNVGAYLKEEDAIEVVEGLKDDPLTIKAWYFYRDLAK